MSTSVEVEGAPPLRQGACAVIAEAGANHNNSVERAIEMARRAHAAGAWGVKFQFYKAATIAVRNSPKYWTDDIGTDTQFDAFELSDHLDYLDYRPVFEECRDLGIACFATPFDDDAVEAMEQLRAPIYKVASGDITHRPLLEAIRETGKPVFLSTGASTMDEIHAALSWLGDDPRRVIPLVCTLTYPTPDPDGNFARIETLRRELSPYLIGMSDHTLGVAGAWMTAALGGVCIEKHYTIDKSLGDVPDHAMSVDPDELRMMVHACDRAATLRGSSTIEVVPSEEPARQLARRSVVAASALPAGTRIDRSHLAFKRPGGGLAPCDSDKIIGRTTKRDLLFDQMIELSDLQQHGN